MSDSGESLFRADKANRNAAFSFRNDTADAVVDGDQSAQVHPFPRVIPASEQKVTLAGHEPAPESPAAENAGRY